MDIYTETPRLEMGLQHSLLFISLATNDDANIMRQREHDQNEWITFDVSTRSRMITALNQFGYRSVKTRFKLNLMPFNWQM